jgi:outer membrane lipase/esterase
MKRLIAGLLLCMVAGAVEAAPFREVVSFGDSLSDAGAFGFRATTVPSLAWPELLAQSYGATQTAHERGDYANFGQGVPGAIDPAGLNYAEGGARVNAGFGTNPEGMPIAGKVQLDRHLLRHGRFTDGQLVTVYLGTNDILIPVLGAMQGEAAKSRLPAATLEKMRADVVQAARDLGVLVERILAAGAQKVAVLNLFDLGASPVASTPALAETLSGLARDFNRQLAASLPTDPRIVPIDTAAFFAELAAKPERYGFTHPAKEEPCVPPAQAQQCYLPAHWQSPDVPETFIFIGGVHFTARTGRLLAERVRQQVETGK